MKLIIEYKGDSDTEIKYNYIKMEKYGDIIDWWTTGKIRDEISDSVEVFGIALNRHLIKSIKLEREKQI